jgi:hypothetical protein
MIEYVERQNAIETLITAAGWLSMAPALFGIYLVVGLLNAVGTLHLVLGVVPWLAANVAAAVAYLTAADISAGRSPAPTGHFGTAIRRLPALIGISIVVGVATIIGYAFFVLPGLYIEIRLGLAWVACVVDGEGVGDSLSTSWDVAEGNLVKLFGIQVVTWLVRAGIVLTFVAASPAAVVETGTWWLFAIALGIAPFMAVLGSIGELALGRVYLENRGTDSDRTAQPDDDDWTE